MLLQIWVGRCLLSQRAIEGMRMSRHAVWRRTAKVMLLACILTTLSRPLVAENKPLANPTAGNLTDGRWYLEVQVDSHLKTSALKPGDIVEGVLRHDVYSGDRRALPSGTRVRLTVSGLQRRRREVSPYWPWVIRAFFPAHENYPVFQSARAFLPNGAEIPLRVSLIAMSHKVGVYAHAPKTPAPARGIAPAQNNEAENRGERRKPGRRDFTMVLEAVSPTASEIAAGGAPASPVLSAGPVTLPAGTKARVMLLRSLSASGSYRGEPFRAILLQPVYLNSRIALPEGALFEGLVQRRTPPRRLSRPGSIRIGFTRLTLPTGGGGDVAASLAEAYMDQKARVRMDSEGELRAGRPGAAWMLINTGVAAAIAKESDDSVQLMIEALASASTDASTAGIARIVAGCASAVFMLTRHGPDVILPQYTEMDIVLDRDSTIEARQSVAVGAGLGR